MPRSNVDPALGVLLNCSQWEVFIGPTGAHLLKVPGSRGGTYTVSTQSCTCPSDTYGRGRGGGPCKHVKAARWYALVVRAHQKHAEQAQEATHGHH